MKAYEYEEIRCGWCGDLVDVPCRTAYRRTPIYCSTTCEDASFGRPTLEQDMILAAIEAAAR